MQLEHHEIINPKHHKEISLILEHLQSPENIGLILRTAEAMGVQEVVILSDNFHQLSPRIKRTTRSAENNLNIIFVNSWEEAINHFEKNTHFYALEKTNKSIDYTTFEYHFPCVIVCGNEKNGVSEKALEKCTNHLHINMYGKNTSLNVAIATSILLSKIVS
ncbi:TrmH family RNA methyltransferase [Riemerella anatipestifer]|uniref:TrmH family RNA methyltransferase n=1 Tax=Riemerella anatipestifer TaxID=34085 RepID=A0AAP6LJX7_RIEAN|nr:TrmH family RNA methyltransferase [Riemerella anatipestifer]MBT0548626.1 TrmH family RNA methyltransferase [Riemerella anatipestifer]MBT0555486.1 TrmH family RNA methyltransferase [Riemerella anatipestifer]MBT0559389.1 TrmH family RNA methyltransferase [Riemerella anatipestifer]MCD5969095.1 TrmH family RNA methyltransferase [Riemerella anatipestifer]MCO7355666.1 TrmH family RNA methyltransferase [Riemerella anatipestifer]